jgi:hypothetical protein
MIEIILLLAFSLYLFKIAIDLKKPDYPMMLGSGILLMSLGVYIWSNGILNNKLVDNAFGGISFALGFYFIVRSSMDLLELEDEDLLIILLRKLFPKRYKKVLERRRLKQMEEK